MSYYVLNFDPDVDHFDLFVDQIDASLNQYGSGSPIGVRAASRPGISYFNSDNNTEFVATEADGTVGGTTWVQRVYSISNASTDAYGVVKIASQSDVDAGTATDLVVTPSSLNALARTTALTAETNARIASDNTINTNLNNLATVVNTNTANNTGSTIMARDNAGRSKVVDGVAVDDIATKGQVDTGDSNLQSQVTPLTAAFAAAVAAPTANTLMKRDSSGKVQAASGTIGNEVVNYSQLSPVISDVASAKTLTDNATASATPNQLALRDSAGKMSVIGGATGNEVVNFSQLSAVSTVANTATTDLSNAVATATPNQLARRDSAGKMSAVAGSTGNEVVNFTQLSAVSTVANTSAADLTAATANATPNQLARRDSSGRMKAGAGVASDDVVTKAQLDTIGGQITVSSLWKSGTLKGINGSYMNITVKASDGRLYQSGYGPTSAKLNYDGYLPFAPVVFDPLNPPASNLTIIDWDASQASYYVVLSDNSVWSAGRNDNGQLGHGNTTTYNYFKKIAYFNSIPIGKVFAFGSISYNNTSAFFLSTDGTTLYACGYNNLGLLGDSTTTDRQTPTAVFNTGTTSITITQLDCCPLNSGVIANTYVLLSNGTVWGTGRNSEGQLGTGNTTNSNTFIQIAGFTNITKIAFAGGSDGSSHAYGCLMTLDSSGNVCTIGYGGCNQLGNNSTASVLAKTTPIITGCKDIGWYGGRYGINGYAIKTNNDLYTWGGNYGNNLFAGNTTVVGTPTKKFTGSVSKVFPTQSFYSSNWPGMYVLDTNNVLFYSGPQSTGSGSSRTQFPALADTAYTSNVYRCVLPPSIANGTETISDMKFIATSGTPDMIAVILTNLGNMYFSGHNASYGYINNYVLAQTTPSDIYNLKQNRFFN